jgi:hypothetical protein
MLTFFRKIRKRLLGNGDVSKYLIYAMGEIALVVIGILIALQINNWNQGRLDKIEEERILVAILKDVDQIKYWCDVCARSSQSVVDGASRLLKTTHSTPGSPGQTYDEQDLVSIFPRCLVGEGMAENIYDVLKSSDQLELISSRELRNELGSLDSHLGTLKVYDKLQTEFMDTQLKPYINRFIDRTRLTYELVGYDVRIDTSEFEMNFGSDFQSLHGNRDFSNLLVDLIIHTNDIIEMYKLINQSTNLIDSLLAKEMTTE